MIGAMSGQRFVAVAAVLVALTACSSSRSGSGSGGKGPSTTSGPPGSAAGGFTTSGTTGGPTSESSSAKAPTSPAASPVQPAPSQPVRTATVHAGTATYVIKVWAETTDTDCPGHAYGAPVITYLQAHPCSGVTRLLATTTVKGKAVGFAQSTIGFIGTAPQVYTTAGNFRTLVTQDGTGNINDLLREGRRLPSGPTSVPSPDAFSAVGQDAGVSIVDAWYLDEPTPDNDPALVKMAHDIFLQF